MSLFVGKVELNIADLNKLAEKNHPGITQLIPLERIPFGIFLLDFKIGGGIPKGKVSTLYGQEGSGKTNLALKLIAEYHSREKDQVVFMDIEHRFNMEWALQFGIIKDRLTVVQPATAEEAIDYCDAYMRADDIGVLVIDSLASVISNREVENDGAWVNMAGNAIQIQLMLKKVVNAQVYAAREGRTPTVLALNQLRVNMGYGMDVQAPGGKYARHCMSMSLYLYSKDVMDKKIDPDLPIWRDIKVTMKKNSVPILSRHFGFQMGVHPGVGVGYVDSASVLWSHGSHYQLITGVSGDYVCFGQSFKKKFEFMDRLAGDIQFRQDCEVAVIREGMKKMIPAQVEKGQG